MQISYFRLHIGREINLKKFCEIWGYHNSVAKNLGFVKRYAFSFGKYGLRIE